MATVIKVIDPVCGMTIDPETAAAKTTFEGEEIYFCSAPCHREFMKDPAKFVEQPLVQLGSLESKSLRVYQRPPASVRVDGTERVDIPVLGMTCAACARHIENTLQKTLGVRNAGVNFASARATIDYDPKITTVPTLIDQIRASGYDAVVVSSDGSETKSEIAEAEDKARNADYVDLKHRLVVALIFSIPIAVLGMAMD